MRTGDRFKLKERTLAVQVVDNSRVAVSIPAGSIVKVVSSPSDEDQTVDVQWAERRFEMFHV